MTTAAIGIISAIATAGSAIISGISSMNQANYQAEIARRNQAVANENAVRAVAASRTEAQKQDALTLAAIGDQLSAQGSSGLSVNSRSNVLTRKSSRELGRLDTLNVINQGDIAANNYKTQGWNFGAEAVGAKAAGRGALLDSFLTAGGSLLGAAKSFRKPSIFGSNHNLMASKSWTGLRTVG